MVIPNSYGMQVEATQQAQDQDRPQPSCWARKVARPPGLKWDNRHQGETVGSSANTLRQTSTEGHIHTHACVHTIAHHHVDTNMNSTIWNIKRAISGSWGFLVGTTANSWVYVSAVNAFVPVFEGSSDAYPKQV